MATHDNQANLSAEAISEYLLLARFGLDHRKADGGCLGYPSTLLLFCVIDALSNHMGMPPHSYGLLNKSPFSLNLTPDQIEHLKIWYRDMLAHNGMIQPGTILTPEAEGKPIELVNGEPVKIRVHALFRLAAQAWEDFQQNAKMKTRSTKPPKARFDISQVPAASSACPPIFKPRKL